VAFLKASRQMLYSKDRVLKPDRLGAHEKRYDSGAVVVGALWKEGRAMHCN
jgi:hypothetical protein